MRKKAIAVVSAALLFNGCTKKLAPMEPMPPLDTTARTASTYTGTTVDFIHVEPPPSPTRPTVTEFSIDMPEFPDIPEFPMNTAADDPFGEEYRAMFSSGVPSDVSESVQTAQVSEAFTQPPQTSENDLTEETTVTISFETPRTSTDNQEEAAVHNEMSVTFDVTRGETADTVIFPDMSGLMPDFSENEFVLP